MVTRRPSRRAHSPSSGFTLIEVLVAITILGILMTAVMVAFSNTQKSVIIMQENSEVMQSMRSTSDQLNRDIAQAIINNNRPDGEQVYFEIKQIGKDKEQSVLRFGSTTERGLVEVGYQVCAVSNAWDQFRLRRMHRTENMWKYTREKKWPELDFASKDVEPFAPNIIGFKVEYWSSKYGRWLLGNWDSLEVNAMPARLRVTLTGATKSQAKEMRLTKITNIKNVQVNRLEVQVVEMTLPQAR